MPRAWCDLTVLVKQLHCTMCVLGSPGRVIWPVWWLVTTIMAENSALAYVRRHIDRSGISKIIVLGYSKYCGIFGRGNFFQVPTVGFTTSKYQ